MLVFFCSKIGRLLPSTKWNNLFELSTKNWCFIIVAPFGKGEVWTHKEKIWIIEIEMLEIEDALRSLLKYA